MSELFDSMCLCHSPDLQKRTDVKTQEDSLMWLSQVRKDFRTVSSTKKYLLIIILKIPQLKTSDTRLNCKPNQHLR